MANIFSNFNRIFHVNSSKDVFPSAPTINSKKTSTLTKTTSTFKNAASSTVDTVKSFIFGNKNKKNNNKINSKNNIENQKNIFGNNGVKIPSFKEMINGESSLLQTIFNILLLLLLLYLIYRILNYFFGPPKDINDPKTEPVFLCNACDDNGNGECSLDGTKGPHDATKPYVYRPPGGNISQERFYIPSSALNKEDTLSKSYATSFWIKVDQETWKIENYDGIKNKQDNQEIIEDDTDKNDDSMTKEGRKCILFRGTEDKQLFGFWLSPKSNDIWCQIHTENEAGVILEEGTIIKNIPLNKWFNITAVIDNRTFEVYMNGKLVKTISLYGLPFNTNGNMYITKNGGFNGSLAYLQYFNTAIQPKRIKILYSYYLKQVKKCIKEDKPKKPCYPKPEPDPKSDPDCPKCIYT
jgi:hypothetical protein